MLRAVPIHVKRGKIRLTVRKQDFKERRINREARAALAEILEQDVVSIISGWKKQIDVAGIERAVALGGNMAVADTAAGLGTLQANLATVLSESIAEGIEQGADIGLRFAPPELVGIPPTLVQEAAAEWIAARSLSAATGMTETTKEGIRRILLEGLTDTLSPTRVAAEVGQLAGLTPRQVTANRNFRAMLRRSLIPEGFEATVQIEAVIDQRVAEYAERQLHQRGAAIAETEMQEALIHGERSLYDVAVDEELVEADALVRTWMTVMDSRVCPICRPLHGAQASLGNSFHSQGWTGEDPPAHVRCRCYITYEVSRDSEIS
jgi:hypothetical protein